MRDKVLAAYRCGIRTVILPAGNAAAAAELPAPVRAAVTLVFVEDVGGVLGTLFTPQDVQAGLMTVQGGPSPHKLHFRASAL